MRARPMFDDEEDTQRVYRTDAGSVDWPRASAAGNLLVAGAAQPTDLRTLSALFTTALPHGRLIATDVGDFDGVRAAQLLHRLCAAPRSADADALWCLLFRLFQHG